MIQIEDVQKEADKRGLRVKDCGNGHLQIVGGPLLVNYYPSSRKRSAYIAGTVERRNSVTPGEAVAMCFAPPPMTTNKDKRSGNSRSKRKHMLKKQPNCHWCHLPMTINDSTIEHVIPIARGGLDNANNRVLAHKSCNEARGCEMPELVNKGTR